MPVTELNDIWTTPVMFIQKLNSLLFRYRLFCKIKNTLGSVIQLICNFRTQSFFSGQYGLLASSKKRDMSQLLWIAHNSNPLGPLQDRKTTSNVSLSCLIYYCQIEHFRNQRHIVVNVGILRHPDRKRFQNHPDIQF